MPDQHSRRKLMKQLATKFGAATRSAVLAAATHRLPNTGDVAPRALTIMQIQLISRLCELMISNTQSQAHQASKVTDYIDALVTKMLSRKYQSAFAEGLDTLIEHLDNLVNMPFMQTTRQEQQIALRKLDTTAYSDELNASNWAFYKELKTLVLFAIFHSASDSPSLSTPSISLDNTAFLPLDYQFLKSRMKTAEL